MIRLKILCAVGILAILTTNVNAVENATTAALKKQIAELKAEKPIVIKAIHAQYDSIINRGKVSEVILEQERAAVHQQEKALLARTTSETEKEAIRARYNEIRKYLSADVKLDATQIARLREMRTAHVKQVEAIFNAYIKGLENELHAVERTKK